MPTDYRDPKSNYKDGGIINTGASISDEAAGFVGSLTPAFRIPSTNCFVGWGKQLLSADLPHCQAPAIAAPGPTYFQEEHCGRQVFFGSVRTEASDSIFGELVAVIRPALPNLKPTVSRG
jgi:hypothetical protein